MLFPIALENAIMTNVITVSLADIEKDAREAAKKAGWALSRLVREAIKDYLARQNETASRMLVKSEVPA